MTAKEILWHNLSRSQVLAELKTTETGLTDEDIRRRVIRYGRNLLPAAQSASRLRLIISQFKSVLIYVLFAAGFLSFIFGDLVDAAVILAAILVNTVVGYIQESKAQEALKKLRATVSLEARVIRQGKGMNILAKELVPGDIILIQPGDKIPADARLLEVKDLETVEASLTGEPQTVKKEEIILDKGTVLAERKNMVYMGTIVSRGRGKAVVIATGLKTQIGQIAKLISEVEEEQTPLQKSLAKFSTFLSKLIIVLCLFIFIVGLLTGESVLVMFNTSIAIVVAAIPEGLAVAVTVILAIGMQRILRKKALVRKLLAAETLGSITIICTDKTGTLTEGEMRVTRGVTASHNIDIARGLPKISQNGLAEGYDLLKIALVCNDAMIVKEGNDWRRLQVYGSSTERALALAALQNSLDPDELEQELPRLDVILFESQKKYMITLHGYNQEQNLVYCKGAPEIILNAATHYQIGNHAEKITQGKKKELNAQYQKLSREGLRVLAVAYRKVDKKITSFKYLPEPLSDLCLVGFLGIEDPLRPDVSETLNKIKRAGIRTVIITGDNKLTALKVAKELNLNLEEQNILEGSEMAELSDEELAKRVKEISIYARLTPHDKLRIVQAWQSRGDVVAMTGDGVNDAPALKAADIGVAFGSGSEVSKETADLVLLDNNVRTIASAIEQGRVIYDNIKKVILYLLSDSFSGLLIVFGSIVLGLPLPLLPAQILWINLITDSFPSIALTVEPGERELMTEPPIKRRRPILDLEKWVLISVISLFTALSSLGLFYYYWQYQGDLDLARTVVFANLGTVTLLYVFSCRSLRRSVLSRNFFQNKYLFVGVVFGGLLQLMAIYVPLWQEILRTTPLAFSEWALVLLVSLVTILLIELIKWLFFKFRKLQSTN